MDELRLPRWRRDSKIRTSQSRALIRYFAFRVFLVDLAFAALSAAGVCGFGAAVKSGLVSGILRRAMLLGGIAGATAGYAFGWFFYLVYRKHETNMYRSHGMTAWRLFVRSYPLVSLPFVGLITVSLIWRS